MQLKGIDPKANLIIYRKGAQTVVSLSADRNDNNLLRLIEYRNIKFTYKLIILRKFLKNLNVCKYFYEKVLSLRNFLRIINL